MDSFSFIHRSFFLLEEDSTETTGATMEKKAEMDMNSVERSLLRLSCRDCRRYNIFSLLPRIGIGIVLFVAMSSHAWLSNAIIIRQIQKIPTSSTLLVATISNDENDDNDSSNHHDTIQTYEHVEEMDRILPLSKSVNNIHEGKIQIISVPSAIDRAQRLISILSTELIGPIATALIKRGWPVDDEAWNEFWSLPTTNDANDKFTLAIRMAITLESMGPTYVKFGQALASRPDIVPRSLAQALLNLQDQMQPFDTRLAKNILEKELTVHSQQSSLDDCNAILTSLSEFPVAAASIGQVYSANLANGTKVAIKVQRPGIRELVEQDATLLLQVSSWLEALPNPKKGQGQRRRLIQTDLMGAVEEFMERLREEMDYRREAQNLETFASLYSHRRAWNNTTSSSINVVVPHIYPGLCTERMLVMEWIDGTKLVDLETDQTSKESLQLIEQCIDCTLSQLLETGVLHADPHGGNLLKVTPPPSDDTSDYHPTKPQLGYVDFGLLATVPVEVRDGLVCAVAELVFERNVTAMAELFGELDLIPDEVLSNPTEMVTLGQQLITAMDQVLIYPPPINNGGRISSSKSTVPQLRFDKLLNVLSQLIPRFRFQLPPYFLNNARALSTLEGMAREINPEFNVLQFLYPYALRRILANPSQSSVVENTLNHLLTNRESGLIDRQKIRRLIHDVTLLTGYSRSKLLQDVLASPNGFRLVRRIVKDQTIQVLLRKQSSGRRKVRQKRRQMKQATYDLFRL